MPEQNTMTAAEKRVQRDQAIYNAWRTGVSASTIAIEHDLTPRRVRQIVDAYADAAMEEMTVHPSRGPSAVRLMDEHLLRMEHDVEIAAGLLKRALDTHNDNLALGALRELAARRSALLEMKQMRGLIPKDLSEVEGLAGVQQIVGDILRVCAEENVDDRIMERVAGIAEMRLRRSGSHLRLVERDAAAL